MADANSESGSGSFRFKTNRGDSDSFRFRPVRARSNRNKPKPLEPTTPRTPRTGPSPLAEPQTPLSPRTPRATKSPVDVFDYADEVAEEVTLRLRYGALPQACDGWVAYASSSSRPNPLKTRKRLFMQLRNRQLTMWKSEEEPKDTNSIPYRVVPLRGATIAFGSKENEFVATVPVGSVSKHLSFKVAAREEVENWVEKMRRSCGVEIDDKYDVGKRIGRGAFGEVRIGEDKLTGEKVAIKVLIKKVSSKRQRILMSREVRALCSVEHENVVSTFDVFDESGRLCIVSEYVGGGELCSLFEGIEEGMTFPEDLAQNLSRQIVTGVLHLHQKGIVHRDLKPENILCTAGTWPPKVKLTDFGLSNFLETGAVEGSDATVLSSVVGSPVFVAPEMVTRKGYNYQVDMWAVGVLIYQMLVGRAPFGITNFEEYMSFLQHGARFEEEAWNKFSPGALSFVKALLQVDSKKRLNAASALQHEWLAKSKDAKVRYDANNMTSRRLMERKPSSTVSAAAAAAAIAKKTPSKVIADRARATLKRAVDAIIVMQRIKKIASAAIPSDPERAAQVQNIELHHLKAWIDRLANKVQQRTAAPAALPAT